MPVSDLLHQVPTKPCHNCRRRRLRCDRSVPSCHKCTATGQECLGYGKLFKWADGAASRGKLAGKASLRGGLGELDAQPSAASTPKFSIIDPAEAAQVQGSASVSHPPASWNSETQLIQASSAYIHGGSSADIPTPWVLVDPVFQDISAPYRHYLSYFTNRVCKDLVSWDLPDSNPFRSLVPLTKQSPLLQHVIVAASAAHMSNLTRPPLAPGTSSTSGMLTYPGGEEASKRALIDALVAKQKALRLLSSAVEHIDSVGSDVVLAAVLFFINVELIESGKHGWKAHLEGAGKIMTCIQPEDGSNEALRDYIVSDCVIYHILAAAFLPNAPAASMQQSLQISAMLKRAPVNSYLCCPSQVLEILLAAAQVSNVDTSDEASAEEVARTGLHLLARAESLDVTEWALSIRDHPSLRHLPIDSRMHAGSAHRLACSLYIIQAVPSVKQYLPANTESTFEDQLMYHLSAVPDDDPNFKAISWPAFIAGAEASDPERQAWCKDLLQRLVKAVPWGFIYTAMDALDVIWKLKREGKAQEGWVKTLKDPDLNFLIV